MRATPGGGEEGRSAGPRHHHQPRHSPAPDQAAHGLTLFLVDSDMPGYSRGKNLKKLGMKAQVRGRANKHARAPLLAAQLTPFS